MLTKLYFILDVILTIVFHVVKEYIIRFFYYLF